MQPWSAFFDRSKMSMPKPTEIFFRLSQNLVRFQTNYIITFLALSAFCVILNPFFVIALASMAAMWVYAFVLRPHPQPLFGFALSDKARIAVLLPVTIVVFYVASVGYTILWLLGTSAVVILVHAVLMQAEGSPDALQSQFSQMMSFA
eukprot:TRINITY_DN4372_c1_g1_i1.p1 TRINITY_DN4372_c1_g1~~TRINITY_DN4372_c1_g1_i1.p1  ORF type:complete len:148 (-),score=15.47 TRINITY_DN4372_c1_g1_i1:126-569(-)